MKGMSGGPIILESDGYRQQLQRIADVLQLEPWHFERARTALHWVLREPEKCRPVRNDNRYRIAKTRRHTFAGVSLPALRVLFRLYDNGTIELLAVSMEDFYL